ncbi:hypothetical protein CMK11_14020 [Candidatus Poribacteria bacterium]|jgi:hypothetical protein|nr:hypothetical protein [Candidatus Poribacteria bacterium]
MPQVYMIILPNNLMASQVRFDLDDAHVCWVTHALQHACTTTKDTVLDALDRHGLIRYRRTVADLHDDVRRRSAARRGTHPIAWAVSEVVDELQRDDERFSRVHHELWMAFVDSRQFPNFPTMQSQTIMREEFEPFCIRCGEFLTENGMVELTARWQAEQAVRRRKRDACRTSTS